MAVCIPAAISLRSNAELYCDEITMAISENDHIDALRAADLRRLDDLRAADQRAVEHGGNKCYSDQERLYK
jgi:hypothetical protein